jgi:homoserine O-acetyltransferase
LWTKQSWPFGNIPGNNLQISLATSGGTQALYRTAPTRAQADKLVEARLAQSFTADANNYMYSYDAARDYDPSPGLEKIKARVLTINAADDERNPIELGILEREIKHISNARYYQIPASPRPAVMAPRANRAGGSNCCLIC